MFHILQNISIKSKAFAASVILMLCMMGLGFNAYHTISKSNAGLKSLSTVTLPKQLSVSKLKDDIVTTHVSIFRYVSWASNGVSQNLLKELSAEVFTGISYTTKRLSEFADQSNLLGYEQENIRTLLATWMRYESVAKDTIDVGSVDAPMATMMLGMVDDEFKNVDQHLKKIFVGVTEETRSFTHDLTNEASANKSLLVIGGVVAIFISLFVTFVVARSIVQPIQLVTDLLEKVSSGRLDVEISNIDRQDEIGKMVRAVGAFRETIERDNQLLKNREEELRVKNMHFNAALGNMSQGLVMYDENAQLALYNQRYIDMYKFSKEHIKIGMPNTDMLRFRKAAGMNYNDINQQSADMISAMKRGETITHLVKTADARIINVINQPMHEGGWVSTHEDITERRQAEKEVVLLARQDPLTGLNNRTSFVDEMDITLTRMREKKESFAVFILDLDQFKAVNDTLGHPVGDSLLKTVAQRLLSCTRETDSVARLGGDEFAIIQATASDNPIQAANRLAERLLDTFSAPFTIDGNEIVIGISIGIAVGPDHGMDGDHLLKNADMALYKAKSEGRNCHRFFDSKMAAEMRSYRALASDLRNSDLQNEFEVHYQTIVDTATLKVCSVEALVRWNHPKHGRISPDTFIPLAEEMGMIVPLGEWVLGKACADAAGWPANIKVSVNLSPIQFRTGNIEECVSAALLEAGLSPERLELEITESVLLQQNTENLTVLHELRKLGVSIVLDDFGTGYSSLSYLQGFQFDKIKIDQSFIKELQTRNDCAAIVSAVIGLGRSLDMTTTAEGVETWEQLKMLRAAGCQQVQGYLFSRPCQLSELDLSSAQNRPVKEIRSSVG